MPYYRSGVKSGGLNRDQFSRVQYFSGNPASHPTFPDYSHTADVQLQVVHYPEENETFVPETESQRQFVLDRIPKDHQIPMFEHHYYPGSTTVDYASGTEAGRVHFPILLAIAQNDFNKINRTLTPSDDLSEHSLKLTQHLAKRGLVKESDVPSGISNTMNFHDKPTYVVGNETTQEIPREEVKQSKRLLRSMLGRDKPLSKQFEQHKQLSLFDE